MIVRAVGDGLRLAAAFLPGGLIVARNMVHPQPDPKYIKPLTANPDLVTLFLDKDAAGFSVTIEKRCCARAKCARKRASGAFSTGNPERPQGDSNPRLQDENLQTRIGQPFSDNDLQQSGERCTSHGTGGPIDAETWAGLPELVRTAIEALVETARQAGRSFARSAEFVHSHTRAANQAAKSSTSE